MPIDNPTITTNVKIFGGAVMAVCHNNAASARIQASAATRDNHLRLWVFCTRRTLAKLTAAKTIRNPELPIVEMLVKSNKFATTSVSAAVSNKPRTG